MNKFTELLDSYFRGEMTPGEMKDLERQLDVDVELKGEFEQQKEVLKGLDYFAVKGEMHGGFKRRARRVRNYRVLAIFSTIVLVVFVTLSAKEEPIPEKTLAMPAVVAAPVSLAAAKPEPVTVKALPGHKDTISEKVCVWSKAEENLPQNPAAGPFADHMGKRPEAKVPVEKTLVFSSNHQKDGQISWANLGTKKQSRMLADSLALDAYSRYLQDTVKNAGLVVKDKKLADSLYRSFRQSAAAKEFLGKDTAGVFFLAIVKNPKSTTGAALFQKNCASCHSLGNQKIKGPGLEGLMSRVPSNDWLYNYILNSQRMINSGDAYANKIYQEHGKKSMTVFEGVLSESEIRSIMHFLSRPQATDASGQTGQQGR